MRFWKSDIPVSADDIVVKDNGQQHLALSRFVLDMDHLRIDGSLRAMSLLKDQSVWIRNDADENELCSIGTVLDRKSVV